MLAKSVVRRLASLPKRNVRQLSFSFMEAVDGEDFAIWPRTHPNTILNVCPQGELMIIERLGKLHSVQQPGMFVAVPIVDHISFRIDVRYHLVSLWKLTYVCIFIRYMINV